MRRSSIILMLAGLAMLMFSVMPVSAAPGDKWFVCKYVGTPGVDEVLQTGQNPISVSENAIPISPVVAGATFNDNQGRSLVLEQDIGQEEPFAECPEVPPPPVPTLFAVPCDPITGGPSQIQVVATVLLGLHLFIDDVEVIFDGDGIVEIDPGTYDWEIRDDADVVLASGTITVVDCTLETPPPTPPLSVSPSTSPGDSPSDSPADSPSTPIVPPGPPNVPDTAIPMTGIVGVVGVAVLLLGGMLLFNSYSVSRRS